MPMPMERQSIHEKLFSAHRELSATFIIISITKFESQESSYFVKSLHVAVVASNVSNEHGNVLSRLPLCCDTLFQLTGRHKTYFPAVKEGV